MAKFGYQKVSVNNDKEKRRRRILLVIRWPVGGIRTFMRYVYSRFDPQKYEFTLLAPEVDELKVLLNNLDSLNIKCKPVEDRPSMARFAGVTVNEILRGHFDLIHSHGLISGISAALGALLSGTPHILTLHDLFLDKQFEGYSGRLRKLGISLALLQPDVIHNVSYDAKTNMLSKTFFAKRIQHRLVVIPHGIETSLFFNAKGRNLRRDLNLPQNTFLIGFFGRFMSPKGFKYLVDAIEMLHKRPGLPRKPVVIAVGEGGFQSREKREIIKRGLEKYFVFMPFIPDISSVIKGMDVVAMPSVWEACGLLAMETLVAGVPLISTSCMGLREVVAKTPSRVVPPANSDAFANALIDEMVNNTTENSMQYAGYAAKRFDVKDESEELEKLYGFFHGKKY
jgi:glycosyltransferase involved in cell wall biosynthesis